MSKRYIVKLSIAIIVSYFCQIVSAQELNITQQRYLEEVVETISENSESTTDLTSLFVDLSYYFTHPLNINSTTSDQLSELHLLNDYQIAIIIEYRKRNGNINSINELLYLPGFRQQDIEFLENFLIFEDPKIKAKIDKDLIRNSRHQVVFKYQRVLERQKGFKSLPDSVLNKLPDKSRYLGSPDKLYFRYKGSFGKFIKTGILMEKDAGEEFFRGSNSYGFDFYSAHISYNSKHGLIKNITLGDYHISWGQGLLVWSGYSFGKSAYTSNIVRRRSATKGNLSADENRFLRGASITLGTGKFNFTAFCSYKAIDANPADSISGKNYFAGFVKTGCHATPLDLIKEKSVKQTTIGSGFQYNGNRLKLGLNSYYLLFDKILMSSNALYKKHSFSGNELSGISLDYRYLAGKTQVFGETAYSNSSIATINGLLFILRPEIMIGVIHRYYQPGYFSYYANAFSENSSVNNENGFYLGGEFQFADFRLKMFGDIFSFPWLKYRVNSPSEGYDYFFELGRGIKKSDLYFRYKRQEKPENYFDNNKIFDIRVLLKENFRLNGIYYAGKNFRFQNRLEITRVTFHDAKSDYGLLGFQDIIYYQKQVALEYSLRIAYFNASEYNARIYAYERDVLYAYTSQMHYGKGWRFVAMIKWKAAKFLTVWLRASQTYFPGNMEVGSGLNTISGNHKTEIKLQAIAKF